MIFFSLFFPLINRFLFTGWLNKRQKYPAAGLKPMLLQWLTTLVEWHHFYNYLWSAFAHMHVYTARSTRHAWWGGVRPGTTTCSSVPSLTAIAPPVTHFLPPAHSDVKLFGHFPATANCKLFSPHSSLDTLYRALVRTGFNKRKCKCICGEWSGSSCMSILYVAGWVTVICMQCLFVWEITRGVYCHVTFLQAAASRWGFSYFWCVARSCARTPVNANCAVMHVTVVVCDTEDMQWKLYSRTKRCHVLLKALQYVAF